MRLMRGQESERPVLDTPRRARDGASAPIPAGRRSRAATVVIAGLAAAACVTGCGNSAQNLEAQKLGNVSVLSSTEPLPSRLVKQSEIAAASDTAAVRTFLLLWSRLQYQSWPAATELFEPGLRSTIGESNLTQALAADVIVWQGSKPGVTASRVSGNTAVIEFLARDEKNNLMPSSITFRRSLGRWLVAYMSILDTALQRSVQTRVQAAIEPLATKPAVEAVRQGYAALGFQSDSLQREIAAEARRKHGTTGP
jgi:hypothetical protein